ncbi:MAG: InlB B-repeat-containing protein [Alkalispirochaetaceae bacterium]
MRSRAVRGAVLVSVSLLAAILLAGCPMPINYSGEGSGSDVESDPSSSGVTPPVEISYSETGGRSGSLSDEEEFAGTNDTQVTLSTEIEGGTVYYTTDGAPLDNLSDAQSASGSVTIDVSIAGPGGGNPTSTTVRLRAIAIGPGRRPSPEVAVTITVDYDTYAVIYDENGGDNVNNVPVDPDAYKIGAEISVAEETPDRLGYDFIEWNTEPDGSGDSFSPGDTFTLGTDVPADDVTLYAQWEAVRYSVTYDANGGDNVPVDSEAYTIGDEIPVPEEIPNREEFEFLEWNTAQDGSGESFSPGDTFTLGSDEVPAGDVTLYAQWDGVYYVTYDANGGDNVDNVPDNREATAGDEIPVASETPERSGFAFREWTTEPDGSGESFSPGDTFTLGSDVPVGDVTLYAQWEAVSYSVSYDANGGDDVPVDSGVYKIGDAISVASETPDRSGFTFLEWNTDPDGNGASFDPGDTFTLGSDVPADDVTLYAQWNQLFYRVTYDANGGDGAEPPFDGKNYIYDAPVTVKAVPTDPASGILLRHSDGRGFAGWNTDRNGSGQQYWPGEEFNIRSDVTLYAQYEDYAADGTERGPAGGIVFYDAENYDNGWRYLEIATEGQNGTGDVRVWSNIPWSPRADDVWIDGAKPEATGIGNGEFNTRILYEYYGADGKYTASIAKDYVSNGYADWFVPSRDGMLEIAAESESLGLGDGDFWSSTQTQGASNTRSFSVNTTSASFSERYKPDPLNLVLVRRF